MKMSREKIYHLYEGDKFLGVIDYIETDYGKYCYKNFSLELENMTDINSITIDKAKRVGESDPYQYVKMGKTYENYNGETLEIEKCAIKEGS